MWTFTETGFTSAVQHRDNSSMLLVRSRDAESLKPLLEKHPGLSLNKSADSDYPYRVEISKTDYANWLVENTKSLSYPNFKNRVKETRGKHFADLLSEVWTVMLEAEDQEAYEMRQEYEATKAWE